jgi:xylulokinase
LLAVTAADAPLVLAVDLGTGGPKVALVDTQGAIVAHDHARVGLTLLPDGGAEQDPDEWWAAITTATRRMIGRAAVPPKAIAAVSVTSQWMGAVPVDASGRPLMNAIIWLDARGAADAQALTGGGLAIPGTGYNARKLKRWLDLTGGIPSRSGKDPVGHSRWLARARPDIYAAAHAILDVPDYLNLRLTGRVCASYDSIVGFWCTDNRDLSNVHYVDELIQQSGLERRLLPELVPTGSVIGTLSRTAATDLGLSEETEVVTATGDTSSAGIGSGAVDDYAGHLYIGTSSWVSCHVPFKRTDLRSNITSLPSGIPNRYWVATEQDVAGKAIEWLLTNVLHHDLDDGPIDVAALPADAYDRLERLAARSPAGSGGLLFAPWLNGERTPVDDHHLRGTWFNLSLASTQADLARAVYEGVALNTRWMLEAAEHFISKARPDGFASLAFVGGGARSAWWCQVLADVLDRPIRQLADPVLANARGAGLAAAVALGHRSWDEIPTLVEVAAVHRPDPAHRVRYDDAYGSFRQLHKKTKGLFAALN